MSTLLTLYTARVGYVDKGITPAHDAPLCRDVAELVSVKALHWVNTKEHGIGRQGLLGVGILRGEKCHAMPQSKSMPLVDDQGIVDSLDVCH
jgi:hypothetical protein